jgi:hypothetical protein
MIWRPRARKTGVRKTAFEENVQFDSADGEDVGTLKDAAFHLKAAGPMLRNELGVFSGSLEPFRRDLLTLAF